MVLPPSSENNTDGEKGCAILSHALFPLFIQIKNVRWSTSSLFPQEKRSYRADRPSHTPPLCTHPGLVHAQVEPLAAGSRRSPAMAHSAHMFLAQTLYKWFFFGILTLLAVHGPAAFVALNRGIALAIRQKRRSRIPLGSSLLFYLSVQ